MLLRAHSCFYRTSEDLAMHHRDIITFTRDPCNLFHVFASHFCRLQDLGNKQEKNWGEGEGTKKSKDQPEKNYGTGYNNVHMPTEDRLLLQAKKFQN
ncbi:hypothetical protein TB2_006097 [Malus domestica]